MVFGKLGGGTLTRTISTVRHGLNHGCCVGWPDPPHVTITKTDPMGIWQVATAPRHGCVVLGYRDRAARRGDALLRCSGDGDGDGAWLYESHATETGIGSYHSSLNAYDGALNLRPKFPSFRPQYTTKTRFPPARCPLILSCYYDAHTHTHTRIHAALCGKNAGVDERNTV